MAAIRAAGRPDRPGQGYPDVIRVMLRLLVVLTMLTSPAMATWMAMPSMAATHQALDFGGDEGSPERCLLPSSVCSSCQTCLVVVHYPADGIEVAHRDAWPPAPTNVLASIQGSPEPIPP